MATHEQLSDPSKKWTVYIHAFPNGKKYVGITSQTTEERWGSRGQGYTERCRKIHAAINKYGWENVHHEIVKESLTKAEAEELEQKLIELYRTTEDDYGYNIEKGGLCFSGATSETRENLKISKRKRPYVVSEEYKKQLSEWYSGVKNPFYGKKHTAESIEKMSEAHRGRIPSEETRKKDPKPQSNIMLTTRKNESKDAKWRTLYVVPKNTVKAEESIASGLAERLCALKPEKSFHP